MDFGYIAEVNTGWIELGLRRVMDFRKRGADSRFLDIEFGVFQADPIAQIERLYAFIGEELTDEARRRMLAWRADNPADKHGPREYIPESLDIDLRRSRRGSAFTIIKRAAACANTLEPKTSREAQRTYAEYP